MATPFSAEWLTSLAERAAAMSVPGDVDLTVQQIVEGGPGGDVRWSVRLAGGAVTVTAGQSGDPDVTLVTDWDTALALAGGTLATTDAFLAGRLRLRGDVQALLRAAGVLEGLAA